MNTALKETVNNRLEHAQAQLNAALEAGSPDTEQLRKEVAEAKRDLETLAADETARQEATEAEVEAAMTERAAAKVQTATDELRDWLSEQSSMPVPEITLPVGIAMNVQRAGTGLQDTQEAEAAAKARLDRLETRKSEIESTRQAITSNRLAGNSDDERDAQRLALCDADLAGLQPMVDEALANLQQAQSATRQAQASFDQAMAQWNETCNAERDRCLQVMCERADAELVRLGALSTQRVGMAVTGWRPSLELRQLTGRF